MTPSRPHAITIHDVSFSYTGGGTTTPSPYGKIVEKKAEELPPPVLDHVNLGVEPGSVTLLCGASGSGKSSILRLLNGLIPNFHSGTLNGKVRVEGVDIPHVELSEAGTVSSTVFQNPRTQFFTTDVRSELAFRGENYAIPPQEIKARTDAALEDIGISHLIDRPLHALSGGELQKVACAQAICARTPVLLLDEPTSNLSPSAIDEFTDVLRHLKEEGTTIVIAEHRLYFLRGLVDRVHLISSGKLIRSWDGTQFFAMSEEERRGLGLRTLHAPELVTRAADATSDARASNQGLREKTGGLICDNLTFSYGHHQVLDIDHIAFPAGIVNVIVGPNGAGKSTLARIICGLERAGGASSITLDGKPLSQHQRLGRSAMVLQDVHRQLFSDTVLGEVTLGLDKQRAQEIGDATLLKRFDLDDLTQRHPLSLSGGQKQRLAIISAVAKGAKICIFDEPTSGVDFHQLESISSQMREFADEGAVVIVITHDMELLDECADRVVYVQRLGEETQAQPQIVVIAEK